jgi:hypothetical protein
MNTNTFSIVIEANNMPQGEWSTVHACPIASDVERAGRANHSNSGTIRGSREDESRNMDYWDTRGDLNNIGFGARVGLCHLDMAFWVK